MPVLVPKKPAYIFIPLLPSGTMKLEVSRNELARILLIRRAPYRQKTKVISKTTP